MWDIWQPLLPNLSPASGPALCQRQGEGGRARLLLRRARGSALLDVPPAPSPLLLSAGSEAEAKPAALRAGVLWRVFRGLKAAACCLLQWEAPGQAGEKEKGGVPLLKPLQDPGIPTPCPLTGK